MTVTMRWRLEPGPSSEYPIRVVGENPVAPEDGPRGKIELDFSLRDSREFETALAKARELVLSGEWKPTGP